MLTFTHDVVELDREDCQHTLEVEGGDFLLPLALPVHDALMGAAKRLVDFSEVLLQLLALSHVLVQIFLAHGLRTPTKDGRWLVLRDLVVALTWFNHILVTE